MGPQGAVEIVYRRELLQQAADPAARRAELVAEYTEKYANPYLAAERRVHRRRDRSGRDPPQAGRRPRRAAHEARGAAEAQARQHAALMVSLGVRLARVRLVAGASLLMVSLGVRLARCLVAGASLGGREAEFPTSLALPC